ncbi:MAG TPA: acyl-CoA thioesterase [Cytophagaceae bacterium]|jgi:acyl-CoA thioester hydrolase
MNKLDLPREIESKVQARFSDCDPFNHLNNSRYLDYIINAREDQLIKFYSFDIHKIAKEKAVAWVVAQTQIAYLIPVDVMEVITIQTRLLSYSSKSLLLEAIMWNENKALVKSVMWSHYVHYNLKARTSQEHSTELLEFFEAIHYPLENNPIFEERVKILKKLNKTN